MKKALLPIITFVPIDIKRLFRDKVGIFFVFLFPLVFLLIFGSIFKGGDDISFKVAFINQSQTEFAKDFSKKLGQNKVFEIDKEATTEEKAKEKMGRSQLDAIIVLPKDFGATEQGNPSGKAKIIYGANNESAGSAVSAVLAGTFEGINQEISPYQPPFTVASESTAVEGASRFDYTFSGILGFTLLSLGIFGPTTVFPRLKQRGVLRRYSSTTLKVWQYFVANVLSNGFIGLLAAGMMFVAAILFFDLNMQGSYLLMAGLAVLGTVMLFGIGLAIGGWAKNENQAAPLAQLVTLPMMFLSGVFFPTFLMPELLQKITQFIPLTPVVEATRLIITENAGIADLGPQLAIIIGWTVIVYAIAFKVFRWE